MVVATELYTWGKAINDQLGYQLGPRQTLQQYPRHVRIDVSVAQVACNTFHSACITEKHELYVWGINGAMSRLGLDGCTTCVLPVLHPVSFRHPCVEVCCGRDHTMVRTAVGTAFCWGSNEFGQCSQVAPQPQQVDIPDKVKGIACGDFSSLALTDEDVVAWGKDILGCGETVSQVMHPRRIPNIKNAQAVFAAADVAAALVPGGFLVWGHGLTRPTKVRLVEERALNTENEWTTVRIHAQLTKLHIGRTESVAIDQLGHLWRLRHGGNVATRISETAELCVKQAIPYGSSLVCVTTEGSLLQLEDSVVTKLPLAQVDHIASSGEHLAAIVKYSCAVADASAPCSRVLPLETICQQRLCRTITPRIALDRLDIAVHFGYNVLLESAVAFVALNQYLLEGMYAAPLADLVAPQILDLIAAYNRGEPFQGFRTQDCHDWSMNSFSFGEDVELSNETEKPSDAALRRLRKKLSQIKTLEERFGTDSSPPEEVRRKINMKAEIEAILAKHGHSFPCSNPVDTDSKTFGDGNAIDISAKALCNRRSDLTTIPDDAASEASDTVSTGHADGKGEACVEQEAECVAQAVEYTDPEDDGSRRIEAKGHRVWAWKREIEEKAASDNAMTEGEHGKSQWVEVKSHRGERRCENRVNDRDVRQHAQEPSEPARREYALTDFIKPTKKPVKVSDAACTSPSLAASPPKTWKESDTSHHESLLDIMDGQKQEVLSRERGSKTSTPGAKKKTPKVHDTRNSWGREALPQEKIVEDFVNIQAQERELREQEKLQKEIDDIEAAFAALALAEELDCQEREQWKRRHEAEKKQEKKRDRERMRRDVKSRGNGQQPEDVKHGPNVAEGNVKRNAREPVAERKRNHQGGAWGRSGWRDGGEWNEWTTSWRNAGWANRKEWREVPPE